MILKRFPMLFYLLFLFPLVSNTKLNLPPPESSYNVLMLLPFGSESHRNCFIPLAESLAERGHKITILSGLPNKCKHPNIKEVNHGIVILDDTLHWAAPVLSMFNLRDDDPTGFVSLFKYILPIIAERLYETPEVMKLYNRRDDFDLILIDEMFNEPAYPFVVGKKYASISTPGIVSPSSAILGNVLNPSYVPSYLSDYERPYSFIQRFKNLFAHVFLPVFWRHWEIFPIVEQKLKKKFPNLPPLGEIEKGLSLVLLNTHFALDVPIPLLPSQLEVGGMHCKPGQPLPKDLQTFIDGAGSEGVIYFSLGSVQQSKTMPEKYKKVLLETFSQLKQRVIWKLEEEIKDLPKNILLKKWLPQQDILAHPNVKLFITHGGLLGVQETIYHAKPVLTIPIFADQLKNARMVQAKHFGKYLIWEDLNVEMVKSTINEIISDSTYKNAIQTASLTFRDQQNTPLEKAVWWTEYFIRHKGAPQLKSPGGNLSWIEYLMIDIIVVTLLVPFAVYWLIKKFIFMIKCCIFCSPKTEKSQKRKKE